MFGLLIREGKNRGSLKNIGDYVQSIAQKQFLAGQETCFVEIEELSDFESKDTVNVIMNGWFTWNCQKFLPPSCINPLFISFHLTPPQEKAFFTPEITAYLKKHAPIGARDLKTMEMMQAHGIESYFSGCLTLTLGKNYRTDTHNGKVFIVDPYLEMGGDKNLPTPIKLWNSIKFLFKHYNKVKALKNRYVDTFSSPFAKISRKLDHYIQIATFYELYSQRFNDEILLSAEYRSALVDNKLSNNEKFELADEMLKEYANAKLVITSRLHVSFPCIAMGTKNIFVYPSTKTEDKSVVRYSGRLKGLEDTVVSLEMKNCTIVNNNDNLPEIITIENAPECKNGYKYYDNLLTKKVTEFVNANCK